MKEEKRNDIVTTDGDEGVVYDAEIVGGNGPQDGQAPWQPPMRPLWMDLLAILGVYVGTTLVAILVAGMLIKMLGADEVKTLLWAQIAVYPVVIAFSVWLLRKRPGAKKPLLSFSFKKANPLLILWSFLLLFIMGVVIEPLLNLFPSQSLDDLHGMILGAGGLGMFMTIICAPVFEEILFRGILQGSTMREYGPIKGVLIASAVFALAHFNSPQQVVNAFFCGIILGYLYYRTGSLTPAILIHFLNNSIAYIGMRMFPDSTGETMRQLINHDVWYWIIYAACAVIFVLALVNVWKQLNKADEKAGLQTK